MKRFLFTAIIVLATLILFELGLRPIYGNLLCRMEQPVRQGEKSVPGSYRSVTQEWDIIVKINSDGFRNEFVGPCDIVAIGDSFTEGYGVDKPWPKVLQEQIGCKVYNAGVTASSLLDYITIYRRNFKLPKVKTVLLAFYVGNDFITNSTAKQEHIDNNSHSLISIKIKTWLNAHSVLYAMTRHSIHHNELLLGILSRFITPHYMVEQDIYTKIDVSATVRALNDFYAELAEDEKTLIVVVIPTKEQVDDTLWAKVGRPDTCRFYQTEALKAGLTFAVIECNLKREHYFHVDPHLNQNGHAALGKIMDNAKIMEGYEACRKEMEGKR